MTAAPHPAPHSESKPEPKPEPPKAAAREAPPPDPQEVKLNPPQPAPPAWADPPPATKQGEPWSPKPDRYPASETWPKGYYADGMPAAVEQRARAAWIDRLGLAKYDETIDERPKDAQPKRAPAQVPGVGPTSQPDPHGAAPS